MEKVLPSIIIGIMLGIIIMLIGLFFDISFSDIEIVILIGIFLANSMFWYKQLVDPFNK